MERGFQLWPEQASTFARSVDSVYGFLLVLSLFFSLLIAGLIVFFAVRYRRRSEDYRPPAPGASLWLEIVWIGVPFALTMVIFGWGAAIYLREARPPANAMTLYAVGKQWMWMFQHPAGAREIDELHVPAGRPVKLLMTSEDVIHSFYVPAFRVKMDLVPGRYTTAWFEATKPGKYHLFCAEYCGTFHSRMIGWVTVLAPAAYEDWLARASTGKPTPEAAGEALFRKFACTTCHRATAVDTSASRAPDLAGLYGQLVRLTDGTQVVADDAYLRESILRPSSRIVAGYANVMPTFQGQITEEELMQLIAYLKTLAPHEPDAR